LRKILSVGMYRAISNKLFLVRVRLSLDRNF
jgi:hypothetical protein